MVRTFGIISFLLVIAIGVLLILGMWDIVPINWATVGKSGMTLLILFFVFCLCFAIYGMFFWKGKTGVERKFPSSSKEKEMMDAARKGN